MRIRLAVGDKLESLVSMTGRDPEETRLGRLFNFLMLVSIGITAALALVFLMMQPLRFVSPSLSWVAAAFPLVFIPLSLGCILATKRGHVQPSIKAYVWINFIAIALAAWLFDGVDSPAWLLFVWTITIAGTLLAPSYALWMTASVTAYFFSLLIFAQSGHYSPPLTFGEAGREFVSMACLIIMLISTVGLLTYLNMRSLRETMGSLQKEIVDRMLAEAHLRESEEKYRSVFDNARDAIFTLAPDTTFTSLNLASEILSGWSKGELIGKPFAPIVHPADLPKANEIFQKIMRGEATDVFELRVRKRCGDYFIGEYTVTPIKQQGSVSLLGHVRDVTERRRMEDALRKSEERYRGLFEDSPVSLWEEDFSEVKKRLSDLRLQGITDLQDYLKNNPGVVKECAERVKILDVNKATLKLYKGGSKADLLKNLNTIFTANSYDDFQRELVSIAEGKTDFEWEGTNQNLNGEQLLINLHWSTVPGYEESLTKVMVSMTDITARKQAEKKLEYVSTHDALTGLYNRSYFNEELARLEQGRQFPVSIVMADVDGMKTINDTRGHAIGDTLLQRAAQVLMSAFRAEDIVARIGGDEFAVLLPNTSAHVAGPVVMRVRNMLADHESPAQSPAVSLSIGVATAEHRRPLSEVMKEADDLMYCEKQSKKRAGASGL